MADVGDIFTVEIFFEDFPDKSKLRPVLIVDVEDNLYLVAEITSTPPKMPLATSTALKNQFIAGEKQVY